MKRIILYCLVFVGIWILAPEDRAEIGDLIPIEVIEIRQEENRIRVTTDTENAGTGSTVKEAFEDLKATSPGIVYLSTTEFVLLTEESQGLLPELRNHVKTGAGVCLIEEDLNLMDAAAYLSVHNPKYKMCDDNSNGSIEVLREKEGRLILEEK